MYDLIGFDQQARDALHKQQMSKVWASLNDLNQNLGRNLNSSVDKLSNDINATNEGQGNLANDFKEEINRIEFVLNTSIEKLSNELVEKNEKQDRLVIEMREQFNVELERLSNNLMATVVKQECLAIKNKAEISRIESTTSDLIKDEIAVQ